MNRLLAYLGRFAAILLGFICACLAASAFLHLLALGGFDWLSADWHMEMTVWFSVVFMTALIGSFAFIPAIILIVIAEITATRGWLAYSLCGGGVGFVAAFMMRSSGPALDGMEGSLSPAATGLSFAVIAAGMIGGLAYWLITGRAAGLWLDRITAPERSGS